MTALGSELVGRTKYNDILLRVSGDLSFNYSVVPRGEHTAVGIPFNTLNRAMEFARKTGRLGIKRQYEIYRNSVPWYNSKKTEADGIKFQGGKSRYLPMPKAKKYVGRNEDEGAYGEYAEKVRRML